MIFYGFLAFMHEATASWVNSHTHDFNALDLFEDGIVKNGHKEVKTDHCDALVFGRPLHHNFNCFVAYYYEKDFDFVQ